MNLRRDPLGVEPLYYWVKNPVVNGPSVRALFDQGVPRKLSLRGLMGYLVYGAVPSPLTLVEDVYMLPAGHKLEDGRVERYWKPSFEPKFSRLEDAQAAVTAQVRASVKAAMEVGDRVPAAFLSGGIDSSSIVALMRQQHGGEIRTYCVKHEDDQTEESKWARMVAERNHTKHTELLLTDSMMREGILKAVNSYDQPTLDGINFWFASKLVKQAGEDVILSGEGGDELFAGYDRFSKHAMAYRWSARLAACRSSIWGGLLGPIVERFAPNEKVRKLGALMHLDCDPYSLPRRVFSPQQAKRFVRPELRVPTEDYQQAVTQGYAPDKRDLINRISWFELQTVTTDMWLRDGYQTAAAHGLVTRTPLLDPALVELVLTIPGALKVSPDYLKPLLVHAVGKGLPMECVTRKKQGFALPFQRYFTGELKEMINGFLEGCDLLLFDPAAVRRLGAAYRAGRVNWSRVWTLFVVERWCRNNHIEI